MESIIYTERVSGGMGNILIEGYSLPHIFFDPLAKLWATIRKEARKKFKVDVAGTFIYDDIKGITSCNFFLNYSIIEFSTTTEEEYREQFKNSFSKIADGFEAIIDIFIEDEAFNEYIELDKKATELFEKLFEKLKEEESEEDERELTNKALRQTITVMHGDFDRLFNIFLKDLGIRQM